MKAPTDALRVIASVDLTKETLAAHEDIKAMMRCSVVGKSRRTRPPKSETFLYSVEFAVTFSYIQCGLIELALGVY